MLSENTTAFAAKTETVSGLLVKYPKRGAPKTNAAPQRIARLPGQLNLAVWKGNLALTVELKRL